MKLFHAWALSAWRFLYDFVKDNEMNVEEIVIKFLKSEGAVGLRDDEGCCSCEIDDLFPCCEGFAIKCVPMHRLDSETKVQNELHE